MKENTLVNAPKSCSICNSHDFHLQGSFSEKPSNETDYGFNPYNRSLYSCDNCGHFINNYGEGMDLSCLYEGDYWDSTYAHKIEDTFHRIMNLTSDQSDNRGRVSYINGFFDMINIDIKSIKALDIGSGLAVFPAVMKEYGWDITALDPDNNAAEHARKVANVSAISADYLKETIDGEFDLISLNKVLEHIPDMIGMLRKVRSNLGDGGYVYLELPDGEAAIKDHEGAFREEFFVEHYCAFSFSSFALLVKKSGFKLITMERLVEPSGKYTLRGFLKVA